MRKTIFTFVFISLSLLLIGCASEPAPVETPPQTEVPAPQPAAPPPASAPTPPKETAAPAAAPEEEFDPTSISDEVFNTTKTDIQHFIQNLNRIVRARDYRGWVKNLGEDYIKEKSSPEFLAQTTAQLKSLRITVRSLNDYFTYVVVPAHQNDTIEDIKFVSQHRIVAYTLTSKGEKVILYNLELIDGVWKIVN